MTRIRWTRLWRSQRLPATFRHGCNRSAYEHLRTVRTLCCGVEDRKFSTRSLPVEHAHAARPKHIRIEAASRAQEAKQPAKHRKRSSQQSRGKSIKKKHGYSRPPSNSFSDGPNLSKDVPQAVDFHFQCHAAPVITARVDRATMMCSKNLGRRDWRHSSRHARSSSQKSRLCSAARRSSRRTAFG